MAWGAPRSARPRWIERRKRQVRWIESLLTAGGSTPEVFCDISGGAGYYTLEYARKFKWVIHCDLSISSLNYVYEKAKVPGSTTSCSFGSTTSARRLTTTCRSYSAATR